MLVDAAGPVARVVCEVGWGAHGSCASARGTTASAVTISAAAIARRARGLRGQDPRET